MRVIQDNYSKFPINTYCNNCESIIELESDEDLTKNGEVLDADEYFWRCPCCDYLNLIEIKL